ncbi:MAG: 50S ribosomal protein L18Ae [Halobacteria archaeon]|nr:50S ribosomal protein L18Ae [Halobacteria archaeon]
MKYVVTGTFYPGGDEREFTKRVEADNEDVARERVYTDLGSKHRLKRTQIEVESVEEADVTEAEA